MSNSRASLASDYLDNFYASLPPRFSCQHVLFWIFAQFYFPPRLSTCLTFWMFAQFFFPPRLSKCLTFGFLPNSIFHQGYQHVLYFGSLPNQFSSRPTNDALVKLHRPSSCKPTRRTNSYSRSLPDCYSALPFFLFPQL